MRADLARALRLTPAGADALMRDIGGATTGIG